MKDSMKSALLRSYDIRQQAAEIQIENGTMDVGLRSQVTSGKHMDEIADLIAKDVVDMGIPQESIYYKKKNVEIPGWFRATKQWDILAFVDDQLVTSIELKSISGSYGNNLNNRTEEALGEAIDAKYAMERGLLNRVTPPILAYALVVKKDDQSKSKCSNPKSHHFEPDPIFNNTSYLERFRIMCERLRRENIFGAVWFVVVDPENQTVEEPVKELSYDAFIAEINGRVNAFLHQ